MLSSFKIIDKRYPFSEIVHGFAIVSIATIFENLGSIYVYALISVIGMYYIGRGFYRMRNRLRCPFGSVYKTLLKLYAILVVIMIIRGYTIDYQYPWVSFQGAVNAHFFNRTYIICWLMPLLTFIPRDEFKFTPLVKVSELFSCISIICFILFYKQIYAASIANALGKSVDTGISFQALGQIYINTTFIALCQKYIPAKTWWLNIAALLISLLILVMAGRRGASAVSGILLLASIYFWIKSKNSLTQLFVYPIIAVGIIISVIIAMDMKSFRFIQDRGLEDTRSEVDISLMNQMNDTQLIWGKGLNGRYYHNLHLSDDTYNGWRYMTETGYYLLILKGGYVFAWLYIILLLIPALKGMFDSRNILSKVLGFYIFLSLLELYPWGHPTFNLKFMIIWSGVSLCMSRQFRQLSDSQIKHIFFANK